MRSKAILVMAMLILLFGSLPSAFGTTPGFQGMGDLPGLSTYSYANAISGDGRITVGGSSGTSGRAFVWRDGAMEVLAASPESYPYGVSSDGAVIVGVVDVPGYEFGLRAFVLKDGQVSYLGAVPGSEQSNAYDVSTDGSVVVGRFCWSGSYDKPCLWRNGEIEIMSDLEGMATSVSDNGLIIAGRYESPQGMQAFRWENGVLTGLGDLEGGSFYSQANAISADGSVVVGHGHGGIGGGQAFRWENNQMIGLGFLSGAVPLSSAQAVSAEGSVIVGYSYTDVVEGQAVSEAFIWDEVYGMRNLRDILENDFGLDLMGWSLKSASGISSDGLTIVGAGINPYGDSEAWIATIPEPSTLLLLSLGAVMVRRKR